MAGAGEGGTEVRTLLPCLGENNYSARLLRPTAVVRYVPQKVRYGRSRSPGVLNFGKSRR